MARYRDAELYDLLYSIGCVFDGEETEISQVWYTGSGHVFTLPKPNDGWLDADVIDLILADRWLPKPVGLPTRHPD